jgi:hypothetical protein
VKINRIIAVLMLAIALPNNGFTGTVADYLIMQDIGQYKFMGKGGGQGSGIISATGHFRTDHTDVSYGGMYFNEVNEIGVNVEVTQHAGSDSDKWLLHEVEDSYRSDDLTRLGLLTQGTIIKTIDNNRYYSIRLGGGSYMWINKNVVVKITYRNLEGGKPEPVEVIQAYLQKHPSTISSALILDKAHDVQWIKDEMDRRLWLCDKWFMQLQLKKVEEKQVYQESVKSMNIFLDYREKYYGLKAADEKNLLAGYLNTNNGTGIKAKLKEYKDWWVVNKDKQISIP